MSAESTTAAPGRPARALVAPPGRALWQLPGRASAGHRRTLLARGAWLLFALSVLAYAADCHYLFHQPFYVGLRRLKFFDLRVYRGAAAAVLDGRALYDIHILGRMNFTYPPFAALVFAPATLFSLGLESAVSVVVNIAILVLLLALTLRVTGPGAAVGPRRGAAVGSSGVRLAAVALSAAVLWTEPVTVTLGYGQIDLLIALLVVWDLCRDPGARGRGIGTGLAAGLKLTPLIFIPYLVLTRQRRTAATACLTFLATVTVGFVAIPADSVTFWGGAFLDPSRTGNIEDTANQSLLGAIALLTRHGDPARIWTLLLVVAGLAGLAVAVRAARRGDGGAGFAVCALTSLLVSPVSWTHHWVLLVPVVLLLAAWGWERRSWGTLATLAALALTSWLYLPERLTGPPGRHASAIAQLWSEPYVVLGLALVACVAVAGERRRELRAPA
jgi:alpha-1,2-mannosyltransferase